MKSILEELYLGNINHSYEHYSNNPAYIEADRLRQVNYDKLLAALNETEKE